MKINDYGTALHFERALGKLTHCYMYLDLIGFWVTGEPVQIRIYCADKSWVMCLQLQGLCFGYSQKHCYINQRSVKSFYPRYVSQFNGAETPHFIKKKKENMYIWRDMLMSE